MSDLYLDLLDDLERATPLVRLFCFVKLLMLRKIYEPKLGERLTRAGFTDERDFWAELLSRTAVPVEVIDIVDVVAAMRYPEMGQEGSFDRARADLMEIWGLASGNFDFLVLVRHQRLQSEYLTPELDKLLTDLLNAGATKGSDVIHPNQKIRSVLFNNDSALIGRPSEKFHYACEIVRRIQQRRSNAKAQPMKATALAEACVEEASASGQEISKRTAQRAANYVMKRG